MIFKEFDSREEYNGLEKYLFTNGYPTSNQKE
jgi:hypothetical protein